jgi:large subunit ribosomal protein L29
MALPDIKEVRELGEADLQAEILALKKKLFQLRLQKSTRQPFKPHEFTHAKHRLSQLMTVEHERKLAQTTASTTESTESAAAEAEV